MPNDAPAASRFITAAVIFIAQTRAPEDLGAWTGMGVFSLYALVAAVGSLVLIERRDA